MENPVLQQFGNMDIYVFDQLLKGNISSRSRLLDAGCGKGRNHDYFLRSGYRISAFDRDEASMIKVRERAAALGYSHLKQLKVGDMAQIPFQDASFDFILNIAVLHFADNRSHFEQMLSELVRVCQPGGKLLIRLASSIGLVHLLQPLNNEDQRYRLPDGSERFLLHEEDFEHFTQKMNCRLFEPLKTTNVSHLRCMTTWCLEKG